MAEKRSKTVSFWCDQISIYEKEFGKWEGRAKKIVKRYKDERTDPNNTKAQFNILWSNVQTLLPALYAKNPIPNVDRRFEDNDKVGTMAARVLERAVAYYVDSDLFSNVMSQSVLDRLLPGRGVAWVRYKYTDEAGQAEVTEDVQKGEGDEDNPPIPENYTENVEIDYVHWQDFGHTWGRTWEEVRGVWRKVYMDRSELKARFKSGADVPLDKEEKNNEDKVGVRKGLVYEIWDKSTKKAIWINKTMGQALDERDDPLGLEGFFPCPKPIYSTLANDNLIPSPDYAQYQDQAIELDTLTARIESITKTLKVAGVYDAAAEGVQRILTEGIENTLIPVEQWAVFGEKGGLKGVMDFMPLKDIVDCLVSLYEARDKVKQDLYEISGISDIIRGATDPNETATAQQLKGQFATLRLDNMQKDVARFSRDLIRIMVEIISEHFSMETIKAIAGIKLLTAAEKQKIQLSQQPGPPGPDGQPTPPQPIPDEVKELMDQPTWEEVEALIRDDILRCFRISIETDSTIKQDQEAEKKARIELIGAVGGFLQQAVLLPAQLQPLAAELLRFGVKGFRVSREIESAFDMVVKKANESADAPPQPDPEQAKIQAQQQSDQQKLQFEAQKSQGEMQIKGAELQQNGAISAQDAELKKAELALKAKDLELRQQELHNNHQLEHKKIDADLSKAKLDAKSKVPPELALSDPAMNEGGASPFNEMMTQFGQMMMQGFQALAAQQEKNNTEVIAAISAPKVTKIERDAQGKISGGVQTVQ